MVVSLPSELIHSILSHLCGTPSIAKCALVCHSWLPSARYHLWPPHKVLRLNRIQIAEFLHLFLSPGSTLSLVSFSTLHLSQWKPQLPGVVGLDDDPQHDTAVQNWLAKNLSFPSVTSLSLEYINCQTLSQPALISLHNNYKSLKELELRYIGFTLPELCSIIAALTVLEKIIFGDGIYDTVPSTVNSIRATQSRLHNLVFTEIPSSSLIRFFARTVRYTTGIATVDIKLPIPPGHKDPMFKACAELLETAGTSLRTFKFRSFYCMPSRDDNMSDSVSFAELIKFPRNPNLQEIEINRPGVNETAVILLMQGLKTNAKPSLRRLKLGLGLQSDWERWTGTWLLIDETLSRMPPKDPRQLIIDLPPLQSPFPFREWEGFDREQKKALETAYLKKSSEKVKSWLPQTAECWELEVVASTF